MTEERFDPIDAVSAAEKVIFGSIGEEQRQYSVTVPFRVVLEIALHLDVPREIHKMPRKESTPEDERRFEEFWRAILGDPVMSWADDPNSLIELSINKKPVNNETVPFEETLEWMLADKFPGIADLTADSDAVRARSDDPFSVTLNYRELNALGHSILREISKDVELMFPGVIQDMNKRLASSFLSFNGAFVAAGGRVNPELQEAFERIVNQ